jgi:2-isopropylmalate synthase
LACNLRVDILEAGFPSASNLDFKIVNAIAKEIVQRDYKPVVAALCQLREEQVIRTIDSLAPLIPFGRARVHTYLAVDPELMPLSLGSLAEDKNKIIADLFRLVKIAVDAGCQVQFSPEGYSRMRENFNFTTELFRAFIEAGGTIINCPDTIGGACDVEGTEYFVEKMNRHASIIEREFPDKQITWSTHCHNDFGLAVQNSINAVFRGPARQIEGCINGTGERAGNAALEQCIMLIKQFGSTIDPQKPFYTTVNTSKLQKISDFIGKYMLPRQPHWPVSGENAAKHSSGGHMNAILKNPLAYQPFDPVAVGKTISFVFGPMSGGNHAKAIIEDNGYVCTDSEKAEIGQFIKDRYHDRRKGITDTELMDVYFQYRAPIRIDRIDYSKNADSARVKIYGKFFEAEGEIEEEYFGRDSALAAVKNLIAGKFGPVQLLHLESRSDSAGINAMSIARVLIVDENNLQYEGNGKDHDWEIAAIRALVNAVNRAYIDKHFSIVEKRAQPIDQSLSINNRAAVV